MQLREGSARVSRAIGGVSPSIRQTIFSPLGEAFAPRETLIFYRPNLRSSVVKLNYSA
jgi:hypothetical protein